MAVKAFGADAVAIADIKRDNLDLAMKLGADVALNPDRDAAPQEVATWMRAALPPHGPDMVIDCAGFEPTLQVSVSLTDHVSVLGCVIQAPCLCKSGLMCQAGMAPVLIEPCFANWPDCVPFLEMQQVMSLRSASSWGEEMSNRDLPFIC